MRTDWEWLFSYIPQRENMILRKKYDLQHSPSLLPRQMKEKAAAPSTFPQLLAGCRWDVSPAAKGKGLGIWELRHLQAGASALVCLLFCPATRRDITQRNTHLEPKHNYNIKYPIFSCRHRRMQRTEVNELARWVWGREKLAGVFRIELGAEKKKKKKKN